MSRWRPNADAATALQRAELLQRARDYFQQDKTLAVDTPALSDRAVTDPNIDSLALKGAALYLHTSPEFHMKRLLAAGYPDIYSICRVFRDNEGGSRHLREFTMIEWYRAGMGMQDIVRDTLGLLGSMLAMDVESSVQQFDYLDLFHDALSTDPLTASIDELAAAAHADDELRSAIGNDRNAWLDLIMATRIAKGFDTDAATVVRHYPASQAALARICPDDSRVADRFEVFWGEFELANGYVELTDAVEQQRRMDHDLAARAERGQAAVPQDVELLAALNAGLPECAGVAMGLERVHMVAAGASDIRNLVSFVE